MTFYDDAYALYYKILRSGYSVPPDFQAQMEELEKQEKLQYSIPDLTQPMVRQLDERYLRHDISTLKQPKLPRIDDLKQIANDYTQPKLNGLKQSKFSIKNDNVEPIKIDSIEQDPLESLDMDRLRVITMLQYRNIQGRFNGLEQAKHKPIEDNTIVKPLIRTKRKSWGGRSRIYKLDLTALKRSLLSSYKRPKLNHYEIQGQNLKKLISHLRRGLSHIVPIADIKLSDATPTAVYNLYFTQYYELLVMRAFKIDIYGEMTKAQKRAFNNAWHQGQISPEVIRRGMLAKLAEYGGGDIRTTDPKAVTRIVQANNLAVRRVLANLMDLVADGWEQYNQEKLDEMISHKTTVGAMMNEHDVAESEDADLRYLTDQ